MGSTTGQLGPDNQDIIKALEQQIISTLRKATATLSENSNYSEIWFADIAPKWLSELKIKLNRMASIINYATYRTPH